MGRAMGAASGAPAGCGTVCAESAQKGSGKGELLALATAESVHLTPQDKTSVAALQKAIGAHRQQVQLMQRARAAAPPVPELARQSPAELVSLRLGRGAKKRARRLRRKRDGSDSPVTRRRVRLDADKRRHRSHYLAETPEAPSLRLDRDRTRGAG